MRRTSHLRRYSVRVSGARVRGGEMRANAEDRRECVRTTSRWRNARTARAYRGRRVAAVFWRGCAGGGGDGNLAPAGCDKGAVGASLTGRKGADGTVGDIVRVDVGMLREQSREGWMDGRRMWPPKCEVSMNHVLARLCQSLFLAWAQAQQKKRQMSP